MPDAVLIETESLPNDWFLFGIPTLVERLLSKFEGGLLDGIIASSRFPRELCDQEVKMTKQYLWLFRKLSQALLPGVVVSNANLQIMSCVTCKQSQSHKNLFDPIGWNYSWAYPVC